MMTEQEMRVAIAQYRFPQFPIAYENGRPRHQYPHRNNETGPVDPIDLETMHVVEQELKSKHGHKSVGNLHRNYLLHLMNVMNPGVELWDNGTYLGDWTHAIKTAEATAKQRAEAMCRTLFPERFKE